MTDEWISTENWPVSATDEEGTLTLPADCNGPTQSLPYDNAAIWIVESWPVGTTTVTCSATDQAGNVGTGSFTVTIMANAPALENPEFPQEIIEELDQKTIPMVFSVDVEELEVQQHDCQPNDHDCIKIEGTIEIDEGLNTAGLLFPDIYMRVYVFGENGIEKYNEVLGLVNINFDVDTNLGPITDEMSVKHLLREPLNYGEYINTVEFEHHIDIRQWDAGFYKLTVRSDIAEPHTGCGELGTSDYEWLCHFNEMKRSLNFELYPTMIGSTDLLVESLSLESNVPGETGDNIVIEENLSPVVE